jgi:hypothetical protein
MSLRAALSVQGEMRAELEAAETQLSAASAIDGETADIVRTAVQARTVLYVGGRPGQIQAIRNLVEQADGEFIYHDGGLEQRKGLLAGEVGKADLVFFPVDCVSHDAVVLLKRLCGQAAKRYRPLRTASIASFIAALSDEFASRPELGQI